MGSTIAVRTIKIKTGDVREIELTANRICMKDEGEGQPKTRMMQEY